MPGVGELSLTEGRRNLAVWRVFLLAAVGQPFIKLILRTLRNFDETNSRVAGSVGPGNFAFQFERNAGIGKREAKLRWPFLGQLPMIRMAMPPSLTLVTVAVSS